MIRLSGVCIKLDDCKEGTDGFFNMCLVLRNSLKVKKLLNENELDELYYLIDSVLDVKKIKENILIGRQKPVDFCRIMANHGI